MKKVSFLISLLFTMSYSVMSAQSPVFSDLNRSQYLARVKLVDEFIARFNGEEKRNDILSDSIDGVSNILLLFDLSKFKDKSDSCYIEARHFSEWVVENGIKLKFEDKNWYAKIKCHGKLDQKPIVFDMSLCVEEHDSSFYHWAIDNVEGDIFLTSRDKPHNSFFLLPNENEQFFQSVRKMTTETYRFIDDYVRKDYSADALSTFLALVRSNHLKIEAVSDVRFVFCQVPGYTFTVKYFERNNHNAGWLIDSITRLRKNDIN